MQSRLVVAIVIKRDNCVLLGRKQPNIGPYPNTWVIPGGGVDFEQETAEQAIIREVKEETNIEIKNIEAITFQEDDEPNKHGELTHYIFLLYQAQYKSGELKAGDDLIEIRWVNKVEIKNLALPRPSIQLFEQLGLL